MECIGKGVWINFLYQIYKFEADMWCTSRLDSKGIVPVVDNYLIKSQTLDRADREQFPLRFYFVRVHYKSPLFEPSVNYSLIDWYSP